MKEWFYPVEKMLNSSHGSRYIVTFKFSIVNGKWNLENGKSGLASWG